LGLCVPRIPSTQPQISGETLDCRFLNSLMEGPFVGSGAMPSNTRLGLVSVGTGPPKATAYADGKAATRLRIIEYFILNVLLSASSLWFSSRPRTKLLTTKEEGKAEVEKRNPNPRLRSTKASHKVPIHRVLRKLRLALCPQLNMCRTDMVPQKRLAF
jgi:hypothetical protein